MLSGKYNFNSDQGSTFRRVLRLTNKNDGTAVNLTGYTARMQIRRDIDDDGYLAELTTTNGGIILGGTAGTVTLYLSAEATAVLPDVADYDFDLTAPNGDRYTVLRGKFRARQETTR